LEAAGAFERLKVTEEYPERGAEKAQNASKDRTESFYKKNNELIYSVLFLVFGLFSQLVNGEDNIVTIGLYASSIAVGGLRLFLTGFRNLLRLNFDMRTLMTAAIIGAAIIGEWLEGAVVVILFAVSEALERFAFDKTGTLTKGAPAVTDFDLFRDHPGEQERWLSYIAALENRSLHPLAAAIMRKAEQERIDFSNVEVENFASVTGKGIQGKINGTEYFVGSPDWLREITGSVPAGGEDRIQQLEREGKTVIVLGTRSEMLAVLAVADEVRESCPQVIRELHQLGIRKTIMLTGDNRRTAEAIARQAGVFDVRAERMPDGKLELIRQLRAEFGKAAMVGDGVNDAPALAAASVGIAMGGAGTDTALETADVVLMGDDLRKLPFAVRLSRKALSVIKQNIAFALAVKLIALLLAVPGWLTLWIAIASDMGATLLVTLNGLRLLRLRESNPFPGSERKLDARK
jgi:Cd2+/Zn2+-exporting ATPase